MRKYLDFFYEVINKVDFVVSEYFPGAVVIFDLKNLEQNCGGLHYSIESSSMDYHCIDLNKRYWKHYVKNEEGRCYAPYNIITDIAHELAHIEYPYHSKRHHELAIKLEGALFEALNFEYIDD